DQDLDPGVLQGRCPLVDGDVMVDRRDADAADRADDSAVLLRLALLLEHAGDHAHHGASVLFAEEERLDVGVLEVVAVRVSAGAVDDREVDVGKLAGNGTYRRGHQEADPDHKVIVLGGKVGQVRDVVVTTV